MWWDPWPHMWFPFWPLIFMAICFVMMLIMMPMMRRHRSGRSQAALDILNERLARGEIDQREYESRRRTMGI